MQYSMGVAIWAMVPKMYHFPNLPPILPILQKGCTAVNMVTSSKQ